MLRNGAGTSHQVSGPKAARKVSKQAPERVKRRQFRPNTPTYNDL